MNPKHIFRSIVRFACLAAMLGLAAEICRAEQTPLTFQPASARLTGPVVVSARSAFSGQELAKYQRKSDDSESSVRKNSAGASSDKTVWIVVGVVVVGAVIAVAAGGGGGGGGGY